MESNTKTYAIEVLRWLLVVPAACCASWFGLSVGYAISYPFGNSPSTISSAYLFPLLQLMPAGVAFTFTGGMVAPRLRVY